MVLAGGPLLIACATANVVNAQVNAIVQGIDRSAKEAAIRGQITSKLTGVARLDEARSAHCLKVVGNVLKQEARLSNKAYYVTNVIPLFGSRSGTFKIAADGTLTEATTAATDDTAKTLLGLAPIREKLMLRWGVDKAAGETLVKAPPVFVITVELTAQKVLYTLHKDLTAQTPSGRNAARPDLPPPLKFDADRDGGAELVSIDGADAVAPAQPDTKSYKISGAITLPEPDAASPAP